LIDEVSIILNSPVAGSFSSTLHPVESMFYKKSMKWIDR